MINNLYIHNFQSHENTELEFAPGVNVIVGASDSGKSAIIRALRWLIWNRPMGDAFIMHGSDKCFVNIRTEEMNVVHRAKGPGGNEYRVDETILTAFKNDVPEEIQKALNIDETNLQQQLDAPFLISDSPGEVAKYFNKIAHLDQIDSGLKYLNSAIRKLNTEDEFLAEQIVGAKESLEQYAHLDKFEKKLEKLEAKEKELSELLFAESAIEVALDQIKKDQKLLEECEVLINFENDVNTILQVLAEQEELGTEYEQLERAVILIETEERNIHTVQEKINKLEKEFKEQMPDVCPLCNQPINN